MKDLDELGIHNIEELHDKQNFYASSMILFSLLNRVFDLGSEMAIAHNLGISATYREIFVLLKNDEIIGSDLTHEMVGLVTYRNLLSHEYHGISEETLFSLTKKTGCIQQFVGVMQDMIQIKQKK
ncbi:MAG: HepT-like ribonuclease domain-containing protein [Methanoregula sp.]